MGWFSSDAPAEEPPDEYAVVDEVYGGTYPPPASPRTHAGAEAREAPDESRRQGGEAAGPRVSSEGEGCGRTQKLRDILSWIELD